MTNPLEEHLEIHRIATAAFKVVRRVLDHRTNPLSNTQFYGKSQEEVNEMLDLAEKAVSALVAFAIFAAFERTLRDHLSKNLDAFESSSTTPAELAGSLSRFLADGVDYWRVGHVIDLFSPPALDQDVRNAKTIRDYRNRVAHGKTPSTAIPPAIAHEHLSEFLRNAGLVG